ncbi:unnamed protein product [Paramecium pentaurelia]|uniref:Uncharacterized protein n=1 Tax=Paramecium pentaurelia TaxID=43138 RepID=A0A8S1UUH9_9CILI|nr:unnamed protein product [Paramecium pentaurelia]
MIDNKQSINSQQNLSYWKKCCQKINNILRKRTSNHNIDGIQIQSQNSSQIPENGFLTQNQQNQPQIIQIEVEQTPNNVQHKIEQNFFQNKQEIGWCFYMISCPFCDEIMAQEVYWNHIKFCEQQIGQYNLIQQPCHQCGQMIVKLYLNDHLEICEGNFWTQLKCPHCSVAYFKSELKDHLNKCSTLLEQQNKEKNGIIQCTICFEDVLYKKKIIKLFSFVSLRMFNVIHIFQYF